MKIFRRLFTGLGLITLAMPGLLAEHVHPWVYPLAGGLAGLIAAAVVPYDR